jgi:serine/threonine protein kinase/WD40 repeat protein
MSDGSGSEERLAPPGEAPPPSNPTTPHAERTGPYQPAPAEGLPEVPGYEIVEELGRGGMGIVYRARQVGLDRLVALKVMLAGAHADAEDLARFRREAEAIARLHHPNVIEIYEVGDQGGVAHFAMELCGGGSLAQQLAGGPLAPRRAAGLVETLARAVQAAHEAGVVHRDLKPANVLLTEDGTPKITDFGLAKNLDGTTELTATGAIVGTASYMAPEQASGDSKRLGPAADVYGLGAVLYACLTGRPPFRAGSQVDTLLQVVADPPVPPSQLRPGIPAALEAICLRCLEKKSGKRFASAAALADALHRFREGLPAQVRPRDGRQRDKRRRRPVACTTAVLASLAGALVLLSGVLLTVGGKREPPSVHLGEGKPPWVLGGSPPMLALGSGRGEVRDIHTGAVSARISGWGAHTALAFAHGGSLLAMGDRSGTVRVEGVSRFDPEPRFYRFPEPQPSRGKGPDVPARDTEVLALAFSRDNRRLAAAFADKVCRWDVATGELLSSITVRGVLSPDGHFVLGRSAGGSLEVLDSVTGERRAVLGDPGRPAELVRFSPDGRLLAVAARGGAVWLCDLDGLLPKAVLEGAGDEIRALLFSNDGAELAVGTDQVVTVWDTGTHRPRAQLPAGPFQPVAVNSAGDRLFLQSREAARLRLVGLPEGKVLREAEGYTFFALAAAGDRVLTLDSSGKIQAWDAASFGAIGLIFLNRLIAVLGVLCLIAAGISVLCIASFRATGGDEPASLLAFSADGNTLASAGGGTVMLWDVAAERLRLRLVLPTAPAPAAPGLAGRLRGELAAWWDSLRQVVALGFTPDGRTLLTVDNRGEGHLWDAIEGRRKASFRLPGKVTAGVLGPDGRTLATLADADPSAPKTALALWDVDPTGRVSRRVAVPAGGLPVFLADGRRLAVVSQAGLRLWDVVPDGLRERTVPEGRGLGADVLALSPDGRMAAYSVRRKKQGIIRISFWDLATDRGCGELVRQRPGITNPYRQSPELPSLLSFAPDGRMAAGFAGSDPGQLWDPLTGRSLGTLQREERARTTAVAFSPDGRTLAVGDATGGVTWHDVDAAVRAGRKGARTGQGLQGALARLAGQVQEAVVEAAERREAAAARAGRKGTPETETEKGWPGALARLARRFQEAVEEAARRGPDWGPPRPQSDPDSSGEPDLATVSEAPAGPETRPTVPPAKDPVGDSLAAPPDIAVAPRAAPPPAQGYPQLPGYEVLEELGRGGMGVVYKARQVGLDRLVALKVLREAAHAGPDELARFRREAEAIARLHHPSVVGIYEVGEHAGLSFFSLELCGGGSLAQRLAQGPLRPHEAGHLTAALARGVQAAHQAGVIHRDLKPGNVLLTASGPKVTDFGLAKKLDDATGLTATGVVLGTPGYMAPEQASGQAKQVGPAADVYGLGAILYACLTGRPPFQAATPLDAILQVLSDPPVPPSQLRRRIPPALEAICLKCLAKEPRRRYASAAALADGLERFLTGGLRDQKPLRQDLERLNWRLLGRGQRVAGRAALGWLTVAVACLLVGLRSLGGVALFLGLGLGVLVGLVWGLASLSGWRRVLALAFRPDGRALALGRADGTLRVLDLDTEEVRVLVAGGYRPAGPGSARLMVRAPAVCAVAYRRREEGEELAVVDAAGDVSLCGPTTAQQLKPVLTVGSVTTAAFSPDGRWLACAAGGRPLVWQSAWVRWGWRLLRRAVRPAPEPRLWLWDLSAEAQRATGSGGGRPAGSAGDKVEPWVRHRVEALISPTELTWQRAHVFIGRALAGSLIAWYFALMAFHLELLSGLAVVLIVWPVLIVFSFWFRNAWLVRRAVRRFNRQFPEQGAERGLALKILGGLPGRTSVLRKIQKALGVLPQASGPERLSSSQGVSVATDARFFWALSFAPSGPAFAALTETGLMLYRLEPDGRLSERSLAGARVHPRAAPAFTPDGGFLVVRLRDGSLGAWEVATGHPRDDVRGPAGGLGIVYAPDGRSAVTVNADGTASLWDPAGREEAVLAMDAPPIVTVRAPAEAARGPEDALQQGVRWVVFSPDGRTLALADGVGGLAWCDVAEVPRTAGRPRVGKRGMP